TVRKLIDGFNLRRGGRVTTRTHTPGWVRLWWYRPPCVAEDRGTGLRAWVWHYARPDATDGARTHRVRPLLRRSLSADQRAQKMTVRAKRKDLEVVLGLAKIILDRCKANWP